jgi:hypothetical protein
MVRNVVILLLCVLSLVTGDSKGIRHRRRAVLEITKKESAAELLNALWKTDGIQPQNRRDLGATLAGGKGGEAGTEISKVAGTKISKGAGKKMSKGAGKKSLTKAGKSSQGKKSSPKKGSDDMSMNYRYF